jgi:hypothetical protein
MSRIHKAFTLTNMTGRSLPQEKYAGCMAWTWNRAQIAQAHFDFLVRHGPKVDFLGSAQYGVDRKNGAILLKSACFPMINLVQGINPERVERPPAIWF